MIDSKNEDVSQKVEWFQENVSPLIRYGYNQACLDVIELAKDDNLRFCGLVNL